MASTAVPVTLFIGLAFIICVMLFRKGIVGEIIAILPGAWSNGPDRNEVEPR
jgi:branched-chain amino acid transport system permease protein